MACYPQLGSLACVPPHLSLSLISADADRHEEFFGYSDQFPIFRSKKFPTFRSKHLWHSGQFPIFRSKKFPMIRLKYLWHSGQFPGIQTKVVFRPVSDFQIEEVSDIQVEALMALRPVSDFQIEEVSDDQVEVLVAFRPISWYPDQSGIHASFPVVRPKWYPGRSGIQTEAAFRPISRYLSCFKFIVNFALLGCLTIEVRSSFPVKGNYVALILIPDEVRRQEIVRDLSGHPFPFFVWVCLTASRLEYQTPLFSNISSILLSVDPVEYDGCVGVLIPSLRITDSRSHLSLVARPCLFPVTKVTRSGRVFGPVFPKDKEESVVGKKVEVHVVDPVGASKDKSGESSNLKANDNDDVLQLIRRSEFNMVEQLLQTSSKISVLSLLMNFEEYREAPQRVLEQAFVEHDVTMYQFNHVMDNITSCNNLSFYDEELPEEARNYNLALHISMNCKEDALSNVLVDTGSSLNVLPKSTLSKLSYQGVPMRYSGVIVKAFDGSCKTVIGEVDLQVKIGPSDFQINFQKLKFVKNGKLVIVGGENVLLVSHMSSFSYVEAEDEVGTPFQALSIGAEKRVGEPMFSLKDAKKIMKEGNVDQWGRMVEVSDNKGRTGLGFQKGSSTARTEDMQLSFRSGGFIHGNEQHLAVVLKDDKEEDCTNFVTHGKACNNWTAVDISVIFHRSNLVPNPIEYNDPSPSPNFEFPVFEAEEESDEELSDELSRLLEQDEKTIQSFEEQIELVNLGSEDDVKEVKIGSRMCPDVKKGLIDLLRE
ncbi:hypothetical protein KIW84_071903 [Lathyrus oleraceus]|uniref:Uncharacterized protein n=1 Tax=Pisum sativum TaxID=3888 RepID=A0A9D4VLT5_PEA|nr:hypothetical protein KIW84_071903 [Pisum sativum]